MVKICRTPPNQKSWLRQCASECVRRSHRPCLRRPTHSNAERTYRVVGLTQFTSPHQTQQDGHVCVVSRVPVWIGRLLSTCSDFKFSVGDSLELPGMLACKLKAFQSPAEEDARRQFCRVWSDGVNQHSDATDDRTCARCFRVGVV